MWILGIRKGSEAWRRKGAEEGGERESVCGFRDTDALFVCRMGWLQILLSSSKTRRNQ